jgi:hypothetical protein
MKAEINIEICNSAFNHGATESDIENAVTTKIYDAIIGGYPEKYALVGFDLAGRPLELMYNAVDDNSIQVFHAMKCRKSFLSLLGIKEKL